MSDNKKQNKPNVPNLRFPEFGEEWKRNRLSESCDIYDGTHQTPQYTKDGVPFVSVEDVTALREIEKKYISEKAFKRDFKIAPKQGDILMTRIGDIGTSMIVRDDDPLAYYVSLALIHPKTINSNYLDSYIASPYFKKELYRRTIHVAFPKKINKEDIGECFISCPNIIEQEKIGDFLELIDERIAIQSKVIEDLISLEKVFINSSFRDIKGENIPLSVISQRIVDRNANCGCSNVLTISAKDGLVSQLNYFKKSVASQNLSNYYLLQKGDFAYNKSYSTDYPWGAVKHLENYNQGILSPLYFCFRANSRVVNIDYLQLFFDTDIWYKHISEIAVEGARNHGLLNMSVSDFMAMPIPLPSLVEQNKIVYNLMCFRKKRISEIHYLMALEKQKKFLLSQMLI